MQRSSSRHDAGLSRQKYGLVATRSAATRKLLTVMKTNAGAMAPKKLQCFSVACHDMPHLEFGDKIVLPAKVLLELQCLKVPTPMLFHIRQFAQTSHSETAQYCSVQEFSAPDGQVFIPYWMMQNLQIHEGQDVVITHVRDIPRGIYCRLQPEDTSFLDVAAEIGPKLLMESALRRYSVLSLNQTIIIDHGNSRYYVKVIELKPASVVSLLGDVDLELDFAVPLRADFRRQRPPSGAPKKRTVDGKVDSPLFTQNPPHDQPQLDFLASPQPTLGLGRRLGDGSYAINPMPSAIEASSLTSNTKVGTNSFHAAKRRIQATESHGDLTLDAISRKADTETLAKDVRLAQAAFTSTGYRLGAAAPSAVVASQSDSTSVGIDPHRSSTVASTEPAGVVCSLCLAEVTSSNLEIHAVRCARNPSYHKFKCPVCHENVLRRDETTHLHCSECNRLVANKSELEDHILESHSSSHACVDCGMKFAKVVLDEHHRASCTETLELCTLCGFRFKRKDMETHKPACSSRTDRCDICSKYIRIVDLDQHTIACISDREAQATHTSIPSNQHDESNAATPQAPLECAYCQKRGFIDSQQLERHTNQECRVARSFQAPLSLPKPASFCEPQSDVRSLLQGKLKRRADAQRINDSASALPVDASLLRATKPNNQHDVADPLLRAPLSKPQSISMVKTVKLKPQYHARQPCPRRPVHLEAISSAPVELLITNSGPTTSATASVPTRRTPASPRPRGAG